MKTYILISLLLITTLGLSQDGFRIKALRLDIVDESFEEEYYLMSHPLFFGTSLGEPVFKNDISPVNSNINIKLGFSIGRKKIEEKRYIFETTVRLRNRFTNRLLKSQNPNIFHIKLQRNPSVPVVFFNGVNQIKGFFFV